MDKEYFEEIIADTEEAHDTLAHIVKVEDTVVSIRTEGDSFFQNEVEAILKSEGFTVNWV